MTFWLCAGITIISALTSLGFSIASLFSPDKSTRQLAMYSASRSFAIAVASVVVAFYHSHDWLVATALIMILVQGLDAIIGVTKHDLKQTVGPVLLAALNTIALVWYLSN